MVYVGWKLVNFLRGWLYGVGFATVSVIPTTQSIWTCLGVGLAFLVNWNTSNNKATKWNDVSRHVMCPYVGLRDYQVYLRFTVKDSIHVLLCRRLTAVELVRN